MKVLPNPTFSLVRWLTPGAGVNPETGSLHVSTVRTVRLLYTTHKTPGCLFRVKSDSGTIRKVVNVSNE